MNTALTMFNTLSQETRLRAFRLLVEAGSTGMAAGAISDALATPSNTMSFHLNHLNHAGIVSSRKEGRSVIYTANFNAVRDLLSFMVKDCCSAEFANIRECDASGSSIIELSSACAITPISSITKRRTNP